MTESELPARLELQVCRASETGGEYEGDGRAELKVHPWMTESELPARLELHLCRASENRGEFEGGWARGAKRTPLDDGKRASSSLGVALMPR